MPGRGDRPSDPVQRRARPSEPAIDASRGNADRQRMEDGSRAGEEGAAEGPRSVRRGSAGAGRRGRRDGGAAGARVREAASVAVTRLRETGRTLAATGWVGLSVLALGTGSFVLLVAAELAPVYTIDVGGLPCDRVEFTLTDLCSPTGGERHSYALVVLGVLALLMTWGAGVGRSRPAAAALAATGLAVLAIVLIGDLPDVTETGEIGVRFDEAEASPAGGFYLSLLGGAAALGAGLIGLLARRRA